jgi:hypothetical protein
MLTGSPEMVVILPGIKTYPGLGPARRPGQPRQDVAMLPVPSSPARMLSWPKVLTQTRRTQPHTTYVEAASSSCCCHYALQGLQGQGEMMGWITGWIRDKGGSAVAR